MNTREPPFDARSVANLILDLAEKNNKTVSNLVLQKLVYFAHGTFLSRTGTPLVLGEFEAWTHGPVHPHIYNAFKQHGSAAIRERAEAVNPVTLERRAVPKVDHAEAVEIIERVYADLKYRSASALVDVSHAKNAPWSVIVERAKKQESISLRIPNDIIRERFRFHAVSINAGEKEAVIPDENSPFGNPNNETKVRSS
jgi:uncharacterized phage-associated protein